MMIELPATRWPNQVQGFNAILDARARGVRRLCITSPTGSGKSTIIYDALRWVKSESLTVTVYTQRRPLFEQLARNLEAEGIDFGMRASGYEKASLRPIQLAMLQTEVSRCRSQEYELHPSDIVLVDEYHSCLGDTFQAVFNRHIDGGAMLVGLTATPLDLIGIDELFVAGKPSECLKIGALVPPDTYAISEPDLRHVKKYKIGEDLSQPDNTKAIMRPGIVSRVVPSWKEHNPDQKPTLLFGPDVQGSLFFAQKFVEAGIPAAHIDGDDLWLNGEFRPSNRENRDLLKDLVRDGLIKVVCNRFVLREGLDWPFIECLVLATVIGSLTSYLQLGGRGLRAYPGKSALRILDHGGNWHRGFGSLAEDRNWELGLTNHRAVGQRQDGYREKREPEPITCPNCGKVRRTGKTCPACGHESHKSSRIVVQVDGTLRRVEGSVYKPHWVKRERDTAAKWETIYYRAKSKKWDATFNQAAGMFAHENHYWPPRDIPLMPKDPADWFRRVSEVPYDNLVPRTAEGIQQRTFV